jgi:hypothetical protein
MIEYHFPSMYSNGTCGEFGTLLRKGHFSTQWIPPDASSLAF